MKCVNILTVLFQESLVGIFRNNENYTKHVYVFEVENKNGADASLKRQDHKLSLPYKRGK